jgi:hypothetical protein
MRVRSKLSVLATVVAMGCLVSTAQAVTVEEVGDGGLRSPRHLDFAPSGNLYVAEAGRGGEGPCFIGGEGPACMGATGAVTRISKRGHQSRIVDGLASYANDLDGDGTLEAGEADSGIGSGHLRKPSETLVRRTKQKQAPPSRKGTLSFGTRLRPATWVLVVAIRGATRAPGSPRGRSPRSTVRRPL